MKLSVIIPCRNEKEYIEECVHAIYSSYFDLEISLSVSVIDGMSNDGTRDKIDSLQKKYPSLRLVDNVKKMTPFAFNLGLINNYADFYQIVGARHIISSNYLSTSLNILLKDPTIWCVGGKIVNSYTNYTSELISRAMSTTFGMGIGNFRTMEASCFCDTVTSPMYPKWVFDKIGYFDEELVRNQDDDFNYRVANAGGKIWLETSISLQYYVRANFEGLFKQFYQYGYWKVYVNKKHKAITTLRQLAPPVFALLVICYPFFLIQINLLTVLMSLILVLYSLLLLIFSFKNSIKFSDFLTLIRTFVTLHMSYGLGYLLGIFHFIILKKQPSTKQKQMSR